VLPNVAAEITSCYECARQAREKAEIALYDELKAEFLAAESRWLALARSYEQQHQTSRTVAEFDRRGSVGAITRLLGEGGGAFDSAEVARLCVAYDAVLHQLNLADRQDGITLMIAERIIDLATQGERDPERLMAGTIEALTSGTDRP
jgi:hypothetical protein